jgi:6,7-dimethyl-8-ribityllumazine synthase
LPQPTAGKPGFAVRGGAAPLSVHELAAASDDGQVGEVGGLVVFGAVIDGESTHVHIVNGFQASDESITRQVFSGTAQSLNQDCAVR